LPDTQRLFVGIDLGRAWTERLRATAEQLQEPLGRNVRWVRPELYHVTVVFLGNQPLDSVDAIGEALTLAGRSIEPFTLQLLGLERLGGHERGALVVGVHDSTRGLARFRSRLDHELRQRAVSFDSKPLVPHVTLGRPRGRPRPRPVGLVDLRNVPPLQVGEINLVRSVLLQTGPRYETIATVQLDARRS
jgi:2'-5' RNA ligase